jgi:hypothetical protein
MIHNSEHPRATSLWWIPEHILIAEKALKKFLKLPHVVHHHTPEQLVICEDQAYHMLLHQRQRAYEACGHANWQRCYFCKTYDDPMNMVAKGAHAIHRKCRDEYNRTYQQKIKEARSDQESHSAIG